jgi:hypothetical protein
VHSDGEVLALYVGRAYSFKIGIDHDWDLLRVGDFGGTVPAFALGVLRVYLNKLREVATVV